MKIHRNLFFVLSWQRNRLHRADTEEITHVLLILRRCINQWTKTTAGREKRVGTGEGKVEKRGEGLGGKTGGGRSGNPGGYADRTESAPSQPAGGADRTPGGTASGSGGRALGGGSSKLIIILLVLAAIYYVYSSSSKQDTPPAACSPVRRPALPPLSTKARTRLTPLSPAWRAPSAPFCWATARTKLRSWYICAGPT